MQIDLSPVLENENVLLTPLTLDKYKKLTPVASQEKLVQYLPSDINTPATLRNYVEIALQQKERKTSIPFIIFDKTKQLYARRTRYMNIHWKTRFWKLAQPGSEENFKGADLTRK